MMFKSIMIFMAIRTCLRATPLWEKILTSTPAIRASGLSALPYSQLICCFSCRPTPGRWFPPNLSLLQAEAPTPWGSLPLPTPGPFSPGQNCHLHLAVTAWTAVCYRAGLSSFVVNSLQLDTLSSVHLQISRIGHHAWPKTYIYKMLTNSIA